MRKLNLKGIVIVTTLSIILTGCQAKTENVSQNNDYDSNIYIEEQVKKDETTNVETTPSQDIDTYYQEENKVIIEETQEPVFNYEETSPTQEPEENAESFTFFKNAKEEIIEYAESDEYEQIKEKGKYYITTAVDFIFFDEAINGIYFDDLTEDLKKDVMRDVKDLDYVIMAYWPNYKESISSKYQIASEFIGEQYVKVMDSIKDYLGEENYNAVGEIKDQIKEDLGNTASDLWEKAKGKYKEWKNN